MNQVVQFHKVDGETTDLGMQGGDPDGQGSAGFIVAGLFVVSGVLAGTIGLCVAEVLIVVAGPMLFLKAWPRWISTLISGVIVWAFSDFLMDPLVGTIWPEPLVRALFNLG